MVAQASLGTVYLVGAGPGDPDLLTMRAHRLLRTCDALVYDALVPAQFLALPSPDCHKVFVGKRRGHHSIPQQSTNTVLAQLAHTHKVIVRLKGGDPFVFGRGAEEAAHLHALGIPVQVTPGITAGIAVPAYIGLPVTHREAGSSITFVTGHELVNKVRQRVNWQALATATDTLVIYMGIHNLAAIVAQLLAGGLDAATPAAAIQQGATALQQHVIGPIAALPQRVRDSGLQAPAIVVVGRVVDQRIPACAPPLPKVDMPIPLPGLVTAARSQAS
ncbi:MAG: uroporphyrinogen-III C-methyltransferase [Cyanobacteria bacterium MAG CAR4_bin_6]|nr:uroporphyrinogen-III C-methyltransferase [Cyanobacteria bacterium MAG CAR4_bin_6]MCY4235626.1 uroporphyrinogen-III C-methyltransferase [Cyanobacteria bacterium MAG CAR2_bin_4]MCY4331795.1 uroporphyrinogen-III C-methyltransferase [Cyanobacteria bacterium MAG CAR1_bin_15]